MEYKSLTKNEFKEVIETFVSAEFEKRFQGFNKKTKEKVCYVLSTLANHSKIADDLSVVRFELDNIETNGFELIKDFQYLGLYARGDSESPVYFILYVDKAGDIRGYVPTKGNVYDKSNNQAFESGFLDEDVLEDFDDEKLKKDIKKHFGL